MVMASDHHQEIQSALIDLTKWDDFHINKEKTVTTGFRKGGEVSTKENSTFYEGEKAAIVNSFRYLGVTLQTSRVTYTDHVKEKASLPIVAMTGDII
jgi:hypothetical protein